MITLESFIWILIFSRKRWEIFSTRKGSIVKLVDILDEAWADAKKEIKKIIEEWVMNILMKPVKN